MKQILFLVAILLSCFAVDAQTWTALTPPANAIQATSGYGHQDFNYTIGSLWTISSGTVTAVPSTRGDTLKSPAVVRTGYGADSGYVRFTANSFYGTLFDLSITTLTGTLAGTATLLGSIDGRDWKILTGRTTTCTSCIGASATLSGTGTTHYIWELYQEDNVFSYYALAPDLSGTCTATFSGTINNKR